MYIFIYYFYLVGGKSSVLEALSGIPFPRGLGLVTRCPTCISMHKLKTDEIKWTADISVVNNSGNYEY